MKLLENKSAIVTGAGSGIGKSISLLYASEGAKVLVSDINEQAGNETVSEIQAKGGEAFFVKADSSKPGDNENIVKQAVQKFGGLHVAVNNAGIAGPIGTVGDYTLEGWNQVISVNLSGVFYGMHYQIPAIISSGGGSIVNIASILGKVGTKGSAAYTAAKHGVVGLTEAAALEYADQHVRINSVGPGYIETPMLKILDEETKKAAVGLHPMGRLGRPEEVAELALWLSSDKASFVTGAYYNVDGGYLAQ